MPADTPRTWVRRPRRPLVAALAALLTCSGPAAHAEPREGPPVGAEVTLNVTALGTPLEIDGELVRIDFRGVIRVRVERHPDDPEARTLVRLNTVDFALRGEGPGVEVTLRLGEHDVAPPGVLRRAQESPPRFEDLLTAHVSATVERTEAHPWELVSVDPVVLRNDDLRAFPPRGDLHRLQRAIGLAAPGSAVPAATILEFPARVADL